MKSKLYHIIKLFTIMEKTTLQNLNFWDMFYISGDKKRCFGNRIRYLVTTREPKVAVKSGYYIECSPCDKNGKITGFGFYTYEYDLEVEKV